MSNVIAQTEHLIYWRWTLPLKALTTRLLHLVPQSSFQVASLKFWDPRKHHIFTLFERFAKLVHYPRLQSLTINELMAAVCSVHSLLTTWPFLRKMVFFFFSWSGVSANDDLQNSVSETNDWHHDDNIHLLYSLRWQNRAQPSTLIQKMVIKFDVSCNQKDETRTGVWIFIREGGQRLEVHALLTVPTLGKPLTVNYVSSVKLIR